MEKKVYSAADICTILDCSSNQGYTLIHQAYESKEMFRVIKLGHEYKILISPLTNGWKRTINIFDNKENFEYNRIVKLPFGNSYLLRFP